MKNIVVTSLAFVSVAALCFGGPVTASLGTIADNPNLPRRALQELLTPSFYHEMVTTPIEGWVVVRGNARDNRRGIVTQSRLTDCKVISSNGGSNDSLALDLANQIRLPDNFIFNTASALIDRPARMDVLIYGVGNRKLAVCLVQLTDTDGDAACVFTLDGHTPTMVMGGSDGVRRILPPENGVRPLLATSRP